MAPQNENMKVYKLTQCTELSKIPQEENYVIEFVQITVQNNGTKTQIESTKKCSVVANNF